MNLLSFEWDEAIKDYNEKFGTVIGVGENFGYRALTREMLANLEKALRRLNADSIEGDEDTYKLVSTNVDSVRQQYLQERDKWYEDMCALFSSEDYWKALISDAAENHKAKKEMKRMEALWLFNKDFQPIPSKTIAKIAKDELPILLDYFKNAQYELRRRKTDLPPQLLAHFKGFVFDSVKKVEEFQAAIVNVMLVRLRVAAKSRNWNVDDVAMYVAKVIDKNGLLDSENKRVFPAKTGFDSETFSFFVNYVIKHGNNDQLISLRESAWFMPNKFYKKMQKGKNVFLVPSEVAGFVPRFYFSKVIFSRRHFRHQFFSEKKWLVCRLRTLNTHTKVPKRLTVKMAEKLFEDMSGLERALELISQETQPKKINNWKRFFHKHTNAFVDGCVRYVHSETQRLNEKRLEVLHVMRLKMQADMEGVDGAGRYISQNLLERALRLFSAIDINAIRANCSEKVLQHFEEDKTYLNGLSTKGCAGLGQEEIRDEEKNEGDIENEASSSEVLEQYTEEDSESVDEEKFTPDQIKAHGVFEATSQVNLTNLSDSNFEQVIKALKTAIDKLPDDADDEYLKVAMLEHFLRYLECCQDLESKDDFEAKSNRIRKIEELLGVHGPEYIQKRVAELVGQREGEEASWFGFKMLCGIFIQSCSDSEEKKSSLTI